MKIKDFQWVDYEGGREAFSSNHAWTIEITARPTAKDIRWGEKDTNVRTWTVYLDYVEVATGTADGIRACKAAAVHAINRRIVGGLLAEFAR